jgi:hypothetical protein
MLRKEYKTAAVAGKTPETGAVSNAWETIIREQFPAKAWLLDLDRAKYPQLFKVLSTAIAEESYKTPEGRARFEAQLEGTEFYKEISQSKQLKTIQSLVGTLGFRRQRLHQICFRLHQLWIRRRHPQTKSLRTSIRKR